MSTVKLINVKKSYGNVKVISGINLEIVSGEFIVFVGPSGSGKSTLLRMIAGLEDVSGGEIEIDGQDVTYEEPSDRGIAMVFQNYALYPHMNVRKNISFNLRLAKLDKHEVDERVMDAVKILELEDLLDRLPSQLSGGQRQRVAIGRAIVRKPKVFLFDEPLSNLDAALRVQMRLEIERLHHKIGATMIYVTHDQIEAMTLADRIVALDDGDIQQVGTPLELYDSPKNKFVAGFIGSPKINFLTGNVEKSSKSKTVLTLRSQPGVSITISAKKLNAGDSVILGVRPEKFSFGNVDEIDTASSDLLLTGEITTIDRLGNVTYVFIDVGENEPVTVQSGAHLDLNVGQQVLIKTSTENIQLFDQSGQVLP